MSALKAIVFDFDGVILESAAIKTDTFREMFKKDPQGEKMVTYHLFHLGISRFEKFRWYYREVLQTPLSVELEKKLGEEFNEISWKKILNSPFVTGIIPFLTGSNRPHFVASGTPHEDLKKVIEARKIGTFFREIHGSPTKKEDILSLIMEKNHLSPGELVMIGDGETDWKAAEFHKIPFLGRLTDENREAFSKCPMVVEDFTHLEKILTDQFPWPA